MKAWVTRSGRLHLEDVPEPLPGSDELLLQVRAVSLNRGEIRAVTRAGDGIVPGWDVAGTVVSAAASGKGPPEGARAAAVLTAGGWAEFARVPVEQAAIVPGAVGLDIAATLPVAGLTAMRALDVAGSLVGKSVLVTGGSGGVGQIAIQLGSLAGGSVTAVSSRESQHDLLRSLGAREVIPTIESAAGAFDFILESVGGNALAAAIDRVARGGVVVTIGNSSEQDTTCNARTLFAKGGARIYGLLIFDEVESRRVRARDLERLLTMVEGGALRAPVELRRDWQELPAVLKELERRAFAGKAVLTIGRP